MTPAGPRKRPELVQLLGKAAEDKKHLVRLLQEAARLGHYLPNTYRVTGLEGLSELKTSRAAAP